MTKFKVSVELQGYKVELGSVKVSVEGDKDDAPRIAQQIEKQLSGMIQAPTVMAPTALTPGGDNLRPLVIDGQAPSQEAAVAKKRAARKSGGGGMKATAEVLKLSIDPATYGSPTQSWTTAQKAIWLLYVIRESLDVKQLTAASITKNFNHHFRSAGSIIAGNVSKYLEKERLKGMEATVGADTSSGTAEYFVTQKGEILAQQLIKGDAAAAGAA